MTATTPAAADHLGEALWIKDGAYVVPLKHAVRLPLSDAVRRAEHVELVHEVTLRLTVVGLR